jgi:hypothetical protein
MSTVGAATVPINPPTVGMERRPAAEKQPQISSLYTPPLIPADITPGPAVVHVKPPVNFLLLLQHRLASHHEQLVLTVEQGQRGQAVGMVALVGYA